LKKSLIIIASALLFAVGAASHHRLRYDSSVFADSASPSGARAVRVEYPPCIKGVREDRCIQLYERGVRRGYQRWLAANGRGPQVASRAYPACRNRNDDRCQQRSARRQASVQQARARPAKRSVTAARRAPQRVAALRTVRPSGPLTRSRPVTVQPRATPTRPRPSGGGNTPGI
jgi:hypothetical protein